MAGENGIMEWVTESGEAVSLGETTVTPQSQALIARWPFGAFVWNRPLAVLVEEGGTTTRLSIVDATRVVQVSLLLFGFVFALFGFRKQTSKGLDAS